MGDGLFYSWRYTREGEPKPDFMLNDPAYAGAEILIAGRKFRQRFEPQHAWALTDYGFRCGDHAGLCGHLLQQQPEERVALAPLPEDGQYAARPGGGGPDHGDRGGLERQTVTLPDGQEHHFEIDPFRKMCLLQGVDDLGYVAVQGRGGGGDEGAVPVPGRVTATAKGARNSGLAAN